MATGSRFDIDQFVWEMWWETKLTDILRLLREQAEERFKKWPNQGGLWPSLIPFYRPLRTIEHTRNGDWIQDQASLRAKHTDGEELLSLVTRAYDSLEGAHDRGDTKPDGDGATRWLLLRMSCVGRAMGAAAAFVGYHPRFTGPEPSDQRRSRKLKREAFDRACNTLEAELGLRPKRNLFMVIEQFRDGDPIPMFQRFLERGWQMPDGVSPVFSWSEANLHGCYQLMETNDRVLLDEWIANWHDVIDFEVHPVITSVEAFEMIRRRAG